MPSPTLPPPYKWPPIVFNPEGIRELSCARASQNALEDPYREKRVPQSQRYSLVPQVLEWAFQSDCTASPRARDGSWWTQVGSGQSFQGRLWPLRCNCRFCSLWKPLLHTSHMNLFVAIRLVCRYLLGVPGRFLFFFWGAVGGAAAEEGGVDEDCCCFI
ncbi:unnamed protein product [Spirodela intermedia]|uniref:Uncharacterized protein n=2 Tax=Spirodela intermedia TaxID=51605 RepID=A0A7I8JVD4_SPIIN|nr:unnamed protein product [Spirodela intermedia]CAA6673422.1 unnamed protein product [Spirodela intermedia]CAA7410651.1 unnamed protein product [Spirodela intermedia]